MFSLFYLLKFDLLLKSYHILKHISIPIVSAPIYCIAFRLASVPAGSLSARWQRKCQHGVWNFFRVVISVGAKRVPLALSTLCTPGRQNETPAAVPSACFPFCLFFKKSSESDFVKIKKPMQFHLLQKSKIHRLNPLTWSVIIHFYWLAHTVHF